MSTTKVETKRDERLDNICLESALSGAHTGADRQRRLFSRVGASLFPSHRLLGLHAVWRELCSLPSRIAILRRNNWFRFGISLESSSRQGNLPRATRDKFRRARIRGIRKLLSIHPAATPLDFYVLLRSIDRDLFEEDQGKAEE